MLRILPSPTIRETLSPQISQDLTFRELENEISVSKFQQSTKQLENQQQQNPKPSHESNNRFCGSTTMDLLRNYSSDSPLGNFGGDFMGEFDPNDFFGSNIGQIDAFGQSLGSPVLQKPSSDLKLTSNLMMMEQEEDQKSTGQIGQIYEKLSPMPSFGSFQIDQQSVSSEKKMDEDDDDESCTGKSAPPFKQLASDKLLRDIRKAQRKTIKKPVLKDESVSATKIKTTIKAPKLTLSGKKIIPKRESKNIVKNYGKAMASFSISEIAEPYLKTILPIHGVTLAEYKAFVINNKEKIDGIGTLRQLLTADLMDKPEEFKLKSVFRDISEVFARDFAVNWIFNSRSVYKSALLEFRFKMLRRVREPLNFTFLKPQ